VSAAELEAAGRLCAAFGDVAVIDGGGDPLGVAAVMLAAAGAKVFRLSPGEKVPPARTHGVLDATDDVATVARWWSERAWNIGLRVPDGIVVLDSDPRHGGEDDLQVIAAVHGGLPTTLTCMSGRGDGGRHRYYLHPGGKLTSKRLPRGVDVKVSSGYVLAPPSIHPDSGRPYWYVDADCPVAKLPAWLAELLRPEQVAVPPRSRLQTALDGDSVADWFGATRTWAEILGPAGWQPVNNQATAWRHPTATSNLSATIKNDVLFVYTPNTPFEVTEAGDPHGYTRFRAWATLNHRGDLSAAARAARELRDGSRS
jgi:hypothetical protein